MKILSKWTLLLAALIPSLVFAVARDVQIRAVNFETAVVELTNLGLGNESLDGWRFCSHNSGLVRRYSGPSGLNGISLAPGQSLFIHYNNDAAAANEINISTIGGLFAPLERTAYGLQIYFAPVNFGNGNTIADHLQWSIDGIDNVTADERSDEAQTGGVWIDQSDWIAITNDAVGIELTDQSGAVLHSPANYQINGPPVNVPLLPLPFAVALLLALASIIALARR